MPKRFTPSPAMLVALLALFLGAGGVGYAATLIGSAQITNNSIRSADIRDGTIALKDLSPKARSVLRGANGARGIKGARGLEGPTGPVGPASLAGTPNIVVRTDSASVADAALAQVSVQCNFGERAVGGGGGLTLFPGSTLVQTGPVDASETLPIAAGAIPTGWRADSVNAAGVTQNAFVYAVCAAP